MMETAIAASGKNDYGNRIFMHTIEQAVDLIVEGALGFPPCDRPQSGQ